jgi:hypothetical protein
MHGRPKLERPPTQSEIEADQKKSQTYQQLVRVIVSKRSQHDMSNETFELIEQFLIKNPDYSSLWNYRKEILIHRYPQVILPNNNADYQKVHLPDIVQKEMQLSQKAILKNPKSYGAWYHRIWILQRFEVDMNQEIELCNQFLTADQRNFHCWNYRRYLINNFSSGDDTAAPTTSGKASVGSIEAEYQYTSLKLSENFSNYSAYHHRSVYLPSHLLAPSTDAPAPSSDSSSSSVPRSLTELLGIFEIEFQLIENAIFTEPDDQSAWWYYIFLIQYLSSLLHSTAPTPSPSTTASSASEMLSLRFPVISGSDWNPLSLFILESYLKQYSNLQELLSMESSCKWILIGLLTLNKSIETLLTLRESMVSPHRNTSPGGEQQEQEFSWSVPERMKEYDEYLTQLCELDGNRAKCHQYRFGRNATVAL